MTLPLSRNTSYAAGVTAVKAADLNDTQDCLIAGKHGPVTRWFAPIGARTETNITLNANGYLAASADAAVINLLSIPLLAGTTILGVKCRLLGTGAAGLCRLDVRRWNGDGTADILTEHLDITDPPAAWATYSITYAVPVLTLADQAFLWFCQLAKINQAVSAFGLVIQRT